VDCEVFSFLVQRVAAVRCHVCAGIDRVAAVFILC
jgi:hypothetical protein